MCKKEIRQARCNDALRLLMATGHCVFFTLTCPDETSFHDIRKRWRRYRNVLLRTLRRAGKSPAYVSNYELHPGYFVREVPDSHTGFRVLRGNGRSHGWHIHGVINCEMPSRNREYLHRAGFGRVDFRPVRTSQVSDYLTKHALKAYRGLTSRERRAYEGMRLRLVNSSRGIPRLSDYYWSSDFLAGVRMRFLAFRHEVEVDGKCSSFGAVRRLYQRCEVAQLAGLHSPWMVDLMAEFLGYGMHPSEAVKRCNAKGYNSSKKRQNHNCAKNEKNRQKM